MNKNQLNIVNFSTADCEGGSGRSAYRIHCGLRKLGHNSKMLVGEKVTQDPDVDTVHGFGIFGRAINLLTDRLSRLLGYQYFYVPSNDRMMRHSWLKKTDIIQLFNTHGGYFSHRVLPRLNKIAPIVWRLSDMWPFTAHASYAYDCECYKKGPDVCVCKLSSYPSIHRDTKRVLWDEKKRVYEQCKNITIVAPSSWIEKMACASILLSRFPIVRIPNGIDLNIFYPRDKRQARNILGIPQDVKVILFTAHGLDNNPRKGSNLLIEALNKLGRIERTVLVLVGQGGKSFISSVTMDVRVFGYIGDQQTLAQIYCAADILAVPSVVENLPNNLLESMACGTPAVAFDTGGICDAVRHMGTGYLAKYKDTDDFAHGIDLLLKDDGLRRRMGEAGRALIEAEFSQDKEAAAFEALYMDILDNKSARV